MKKVEFVRIKSELWGYGFVKGTRYNFESAEPIIKERIEDGWEFCGYIPMVVRGTGEADVISLIFQRDVPEELA